MERLRALGYRPHATDLVAALAYETRMDAKKLHEAIRTLESIQALTGHAGFEGSITPFRLPAAKGWFLKIHDALHEKPRAWTTDELAGRLNIGKTSKNKTYIANALNIIERMNLAVKQRGKAGEYTWVHACHADTESTLAWNDPVLDVWMELLHAPDTPVTHFSKTAVITGNTVGTPTGRHAPNVVKHAYDFLKARGLATTRRYNGYRATLTPKGIALARQQQQTPYLLNEVRHVRMDKAPGEHATPRQTDLPERVQTWAAIATRLAELRGQTGKPLVPNDRHYVAQVARELNVSEALVSSVAKGKVPWANRRTNEAHVLARLRDKLPPTHAAMFEATIHARLAAKNTNRVA